MLAFLVLKYVKKTFNLLFKSFQKINLRNDNDTFCLMSLHCVSIKVLDKVNNLQLNRISQISGNAHISIMHSPGYKATYK